MGVPDRASRLGQLPIEALEITPQMYRRLIAAGCSDLQAALELVAADVRPGSGFGRAAQTRLTRAIWRLLDSDHLLALDSPPTHTQASLERWLVDWLRTTPGLPRTLDQLVNHLTTIYVVPLNPSLVWERARVVAESHSQILLGRGRTIAWVEIGQVPVPLASERVRRIISLREQGRTLAEIGADMGITRERARQVVVKYGGPPTSELRERRRRDVAMRQHEQLILVEESIRALVASQGYAEVDQIAAATGSTPTVVRRAWPRELRSARLGKQKAGEGAWSHEDLLGAVRQAALYEFPLTASGYSRLRLSGEVSAPSMKTLVNHFGSWSAACEAAGVVGGSASRPAYESRWTSDDILRAVKSFLEADDCGTSIAAYEVWKQERMSDAPSGQTVRDRFGGWTEAKRLALLFERTK